MIQLKVYQSVADQQANVNPVFLDLYDVEPIKLTLSIEDITNADASSVFSKQFKVPASRNNNEFFLNAFEIDGIDFDVTTKKPAEILVDGAEFRQGHIRLQKIFTNTDKDRIDYELLFLGETRDFSSVIGDARMCDLNLDDIAPLISFYQIGDIETSWQAYPQGGPTDGYANGNIIFPLIDHGNSYDENGNPEQAVITIDQNDNDSFTKPAKPLGPTRFKPMIRAKYIIDKIFSNAGYSYESNFFDSDLFRKLYVSAFGNNAFVNLEVEQSTALNFNAYDNFNQGTGNLTLTQIFQNPGGNYSPYQSSPYFGSTFRVDIPSATGGGAYYLFNSHAFYEGYFENSDYSQTPIYASLQMVRYRGGTQTIVARSSGFHGQTRNLTFDTRVTTSVWDATTDTLEAGDRLVLRVDPENSTDFEVVNNAMWECVASPGGYYPARDLDCDYKQIDFIKDILTSFRLILAPKTGKPNTFIIEPWQDYIGSGTTYDWSKKLCEEKDMVIEPLFNTQSETIEFNLTADTDYINHFHQEDFNRVHGFLRYDSNNELLKGKRDIKVNYSPTPVYQIEHGSNLAHPEPTFIIPQTHKHEVEGSTLEHLPIKPKTRLMFYNGLQPITVPQHYWYAQGSTTDPYQSWPLMSMYSDWAPNAGPTTDSVKLEWSNDIRYFNPSANYNTLGNTLYDQYWSRYINSLYNKFSRRVTAYFTLNNVDLQYFSFDDVIFVNGKYYQPEKIIDVQIGKTTEVQVQLITLKDQRPIWLNEPLDGFSVATFNNNCAGAQGSIQITTNGTPNFSWQLVESGATGIHNAPVGQAPYTFTISAPVGTDTLMVTDSLGRTAQIQVNVPASTTTPITTTYDAYNPTICSDDEEQCNGAIIVSVNGAAQPAVTYWIGEPTQSGNTRVQLCEGTYQYYVVDANGCESDVTIVELVCEGPTPTAWKLQSCTQPEDPAHPNATRYVTLDPSQIPPAPLTQLAPGMVLDDGDDEDVYGPCYEVIALEYTEVPNFNYIAVYDDCATCATGGTYTYEYELCSDPTTIGIASTTLNNWAYGTVVKLTNGICVVLRSLSTLPPDFVIDDTQAYMDCDACNGISPSEQVCHNIENPQFLAPASGTYEFDGDLYDWSVGSGQTIAFCAVTGSVVVLSGSPNIELTDSLCTSIDQCTLPSPTCNCITVDVLNSQLQDESNQDLYYIINDCAGGSRDVNLAQTLGIEDGGSMYFGLCSASTTSNLFKYGINGSPFVAVAGMNITPNGFACNSDGDCIPVI